MKRVVFLILILLVGCSGPNLERESYDTPINEIIQTQSPEDVCLTHEEYSEVVGLDSPVLTMPFDIDDFSSKFWGVVPFCADQWEIGRLHNAIDYEVKPDAKIYAVEDGDVLFVKVGEDEGAGDVIDVQGDGFKIDYAGLTNVQVKIGDIVNRGDYLGDALITPYGEYHLHLGISKKGVFECPIKYMDEEFREATRQMFAESHYPSQSKFPCACNCEFMG
jgi:murein DD-endopeptidase MepM/ murein hydrolase activator NlpD|tara:strand:+ start:1496 stop:2155 length:660 start_codon:yes stop_codon:yes gene_type:complete